MVKLIVSLFIFCLTVNTSYAFDMRKIEAFDKNDRILVLAPHPDDEIIASAGIIQKAKEAKAKVQVVLFTNGDANELAFIVYEKRLTFKKKEFLHMGNVRRKETLSACKLLGLDESDIISLGYPDFGTMEIFTKYWGDVKPFRSILSRVDRVSYSHAPSFNAPHCGESVLNDIKNVIRSFRPTKIFVSHPVDTNRDHRALYLFTKVAMWDLKKEGIRAHIYPYLIHVVGWPKPRGWRPDLMLSPFKVLQKSDILWHQSVLTPQQIEKKREAVLKFNSQNIPSPGYLSTFARKNELFGDYLKVRLKSQKKETFVWHPLGIKDRYTRTSLFKPRERASSVSYALVENNLYVRLLTKFPLSDDLGATLYILGYNNNKDFALMPKLRLNVNASGLHVYDKKRKITAKDVKFKHKGNQIIFEVPLRQLGHPDYVMICPRIAIGGLPLDKIAWRILQLEKEAQ